MTIRKISALEYFGDITKHMHSCGPQVCGRILYFPLFYSFIAISLYPLTAFVFSYILISCKYIKMMLASFLCCINLNSQLDYFDSWTELKTLQSVIVFGKVAVAIAVLAQQFQGQTTQRRLWLLWVSLSLCKYVRCKFVCVCVAFNWNEVSP